MVNMFQHPISSKQKFYNKASISWKQYNDAHQRKNFEFRAVWKPEIWTLQDSQVITRKLNVALSRSSRFRNNPFIVIFLDLVISEIAASHLLCSTHLEHVLSSGLLCISLLIIMDQMLLIIDYHWLISQYHILIHLISCWIQEVDII